VRSIEHQHRRARRAVLGLSHHDVAVVEIERNVERAGASEGIFQRLIHIDVEHVAVFIRLAPPVRFDAGCEVRRIVRPEARLAERAEDVAKALVAEEVDAFVGEVELHRLRGFARQPTRSGDGLMSGRHLRRRVDIQVAFSRELLDEIVEQLAEFFLRLLRAIPAQRLQQLRRELTALDQRIEDRLTQRLERAVGLAVEVVEIRIEVLPAAGRETRLQQKIGELVEQRLQVHRIGRFGAELRVGMKPHDDQRYSRGRDIGCGLHA
jgi:hypothetical protein